MNGTTISTEELQGLLKGGENMVLLNVLPEIFFKREHIPGSINVDGYKMDFIAELEKAGVKKDAIIVVYASGSDSEASAYAATRMREHGWSKTLDYREGIAGWRKAGLALQETIEPGKPTRSKNSYLVDMNQSLLLWSGRNLNSIHRGTLQIKEGQIDLAGEESVTGKLVIDMNSIADNDLEDPMWKKMLVTHLKSEDFFEVVKYPVAQIVIKRSEPIADAAHGVPNYTLIADLTIKDVTRELSFPATLAVEEDGTLKAHAHFDFDRTLWNVKYGSGKFFKQLGMHLVDDIVSLDMKIVGR
jgi:polyisoprenoid-binding protein YceI/rhodanese-related sulfurtransferase